MTAYVDHGQLEISNNAAENAIRPVALGIKICLFAARRRVASQPDLPAVKPTMP
jgi:hypothetical protein